MQSFSIPTKHCSIYNNQQQKIFLTTFGLSAAISPTKSQIQPRMVPVSIPPRTLRKTASVPYVFKKSKAQNKCFGCDFLNFSFSLLSGSMRFHNSEQIAEKHRSLHQELLLSCWHIRLSGTLLALVERTTRVSDFRKPLLSRFNLLLLCLNKFICWLLVGSMWLLLSVFGWCGMSLTGADCKKIWRFRYSDFGAQISYGTNSVNIFIVQ